MDAFRLLDRSEAVLSFDVIDHRVWHSGSYLRIKVLLRDGSELHVREFLDEVERKYSFHWQSGSGVLLARWDNAPHHPGLPTYPDHKHVPTGVESTIEVALADVLGSIEGFMASPRLMVGEERLAAGFVYENALKSIFMVLKKVF